MSGTEPPPAADTESTQQIAFSVNILVRSAASRVVALSKPATPSPYRDICEVPESLRGFVVAPDSLPVEEPSEPGRFANYELTPCSRSKD
jgi:hypothetical protein